MSLASVILSVAKNLLGWWGVVLETLRPHLVTPGLCVEQWTCPYLSSLRVPMESGRGNPVVVERPDSFGTTVPRKHKKGLPPPTIPQARRALVSCRRACVLDHEAGFDRRGPGTLYYGLIGVIGPPSPSPSPSSPKVAVIE